MSRQTTPSNNSFESKNLKWIDHFLTDNECTFAKQELAFSFWQRSEVIRKVDNSRIESLYSLARISETSAQEWFSDELLTFLVEVEKRLQQELDINPQHLEYWQATRYGPGGQFDYHHDAGYWEDDPAGERRYTIILYLETPVCGGQTHFRAQDVTIEPMAGRLLYWNNLLPSGYCNYGMIHASLPILEGYKTTLITWERLNQVRIS